MSNGTPPQRLPVGRGSLVPVAGDPDPPGQALLPGPDDRLQRPAGPGDQVQLLEVADGVDLDEVEPVGLEPFQAAVDLGPGGVAVAQAGLGGQEDPVPDGWHPGAKAQLGVAVAGGHVEVVDAGVQGQLD